jgi:Zn-dependent peptidase ImmA (M78 family)
MEIDRLAVDDTPMVPEAKAAAIHRQLNPAVLPIPVHAIARALDIIEIEERPMESGFEGLLICEAERDIGVIAVNQSSSWQRRRFSLAHELGHFLCDWHVPTDVGSFHCSRRDMTNPFGDALHQGQEDEANRFAIELLAPEAVMSRWLRRLPDLDHVLDIHRRLDISKAAAARRYASLHSLPIAVVFASNRQFSYVERQSSFPYLPMSRGEQLPAVQMIEPGAATSEMIEADPRDWGLRVDGGLACQHLPQEYGHSITLLYLDGD